MRMNAQPAFTPAPDGVDPALVPAADALHRREIPVIGLGTFGSDHASPASRSPRPSSAPSRSATATSTAPPSTATSS